MAAVNSGVSVEGIVEIKQSPAKMLGLIIPESALLRADELIE